MRYGLRLQAADSGSSIDILPGLRIRLECETCFQSELATHAKFHNAQTLLLGTLLGFTSLWLRFAKRDVYSAVVTCSLYWAAQLGSLAFPGTALIDPEFRDRDGARAASAAPACLYTAHGARWGLVRCMRTAEYAC
jgi:hypothetical protein